MPTDLNTNIVFFIISSLAILFGGYGLTAVADKLADRLKLGEAFVGGVILGATTSLADTVVTLTASWEGYPQLAVSNAIGAIAVQTTFIVFADLAYKRANLEHAAASLPNLFQGVLLLMLLMLILAAFTTPQMNLFGIHPITPLMFYIYYYGWRIDQSLHKTPTWFPKNTAFTQEDVPDQENLKADIKSLWMRFIFFSCFVGGGGFFLAQSAEVIATETKLSEAVIGGILTAIATSLPELVVSVVAVRKGALTLAVGNIIGGNVFDVLQIPLADLLYRSGSIYHTLGREEIFLLSLTSLLTITLVMGLIRRETKGWGNIGLEGVAILFIYVGGMIILYQM